MLFRSRGLPLGRGEDSKKNISRFLLELKDTHVCEISLTIVCLADGVLYPWFTPQGWSKGHCLGEVARHIKKTYSVKLLFWYLKARCIFFPKIKFLGADTFLMEKLRILHSLSSFFIFWTGSAELKVCI